MLKHASVLHFYCPVIHCTDTPHFASPFIIDGVASDVVFWMLVCLVGSRANGQERILETSLVQNGGFIKARGQDPWAEGAAALGL